jgi:hypothetical protein
MFATVPSRFTCCCCPYRVEVEVVGDDGVKRTELHILGLGILGTLQGLEALHAMTKVRLLVT